MRILYHHRIVSKDGQFVHIEEMINAFRKLGHDVFVVEPGGVHESKFGTDGGSISSLRKYIPGIIYELLELGYNSVVFFRLLVSVIKYKPDFIYERYNLYMPSGIWVKK